MSLRDKLMEFSNEDFDTLSFEELNIGDNYIAMPLPGDNSGHAGYKAIHYIFEKIEPQKSGNLECNSKRCKDENLNYMPDSMLVIKVK